MPYSLCDQKLFLKSLCFSGSLLFSSVGYHSPSLRKTISLSGGASSMNRHHPFTARWSFLSLSKSSFAIGSRMKKELHPVFRYKALCSNSSRPCIQLAHIYSWLRYSMKCKRSSCVLLALCSVIFLEKSLLNFLNIIILRYATVCIAIFAFFQVLAMIFHVRSIS